MEMSAPVVLLSGGKDSIMTLKHLVDEGHDPTILHFHTKKISDYYERLIKRNAMRIHRTPYYYVIKTETKNYDAFMDLETGLYGVYLDEEEKNRVYPHEYGNPVYLGYFTRDCESMKQGIKFFQLYRPEKYKFPLRDLRESEIIESWQKLSPKIRRDTVSSTLMNFREYGGRIVENS